MPSTFDSLLRLELQATGENENTWGDKTNANLELIGQAIAGHVSVDIAGSGNKTLTASNAVADQARRAFITLSGLLTGNVSVIAPTASKLYAIRNNATQAGNTILIKTAAGTAVTVEPSSLAWYACDGADFWRVEDTTKLALSGGSVTGNLGVSGNVSIGGTVSVSGNLVVTGQAIFPAVTAESLTTPDFLSVGTSASIGGTLLVGGAATFDSTVTVSGNIVGLSNVSVSGAGTFGNGIIFGTAGPYDRNVQIGVTLASSGIVNFPIRYDTSTSPGFLTWGTNVIRFRSLSDGSGFYLEYSDGTSLFGARSFLSDERLKYNIKPSAEDHLQNLDLLNVREFAWKHNDAHVPAGLVAQEVEKILPSAVWETADGTKQLDLQALVSHLIGAVQQLSERVRELEERVDDLEI